MEFYFHFYLHIFLLKDYQYFQCVFFTEQCTPLKDSALPVNQISLTQSRLHSLDFNEEEILKIIRILNIHKAHGHDDISIRMIKICY